MSKLRKYGRRIQRPDRGMGRDNLQQPAYVLYLSPSGTSFISDTEEEYGICHQPDD